ncbi:MAG: GerAB/ArcD/ProY family transporter [Clostridia bacterium]|nr:GerAB/ArcD/ProY family transporter [Clostridia bacterium]
MDKALKTRQVCLFFIIFLPVIKFFMMPSVVATHSGRDMWIAVLLNILIDFLTVFTVIFTVKDENCDFFTLVKKRYGTAFYKAVTAFYAAFFLLKTFLCVNEQKDYVEYTLYMTDPNVLTFMPVFIIIFYLCLHKLRVWGRVADGIFIIALFGYALLFALSIPNVDFNELLPIGKVGMNGVFGGIKASQNWFGDGAYFLFLVGNYKKSGKSTLKILLSFAAAGLIVLLFSVIFYGTFSSVAFRQRFALTEISKYTSVINNIGRFDYIALFILLLTAIFSLSLPFYFSVRLIAETIGVKRVNIVAAAVITCAAAFHLFLSEYFVTVERFVTGTAGWYFLFFGSVFPIVLSLTMIRRRKNETQKV